MSLLYEIMTLINANINIVIILKTIKLKNIIKLWLQKMLMQTNFILVFIAELGCVTGCGTFLRNLSVLSTYRRNEQITQLPLYTDTKCYSVELKLLLYTLYHAKLKRPLLDDPSNFRTVFILS